MKEEREICFKEDGLITLANGVLIHVEGGKFRVISADRKEVAHFDENGKYYSKFSYKSLKEKEFENKQRIINNFFSKIGEEQREIIKEYLKKARPKNLFELTFINELKQAVNSIDYDFWILSLNSEAVVKDGKISFQRKEPYSVCIMSNDERFFLAESFAPEFKSRVALDEEKLLAYFFSFQNFDRGLGEIREITMSHLNKSDGDLIVVCTDVKGKLIIQK